MENWLLILLHFCLAFIPQGSLNGYLNSSEIFANVQNLTLFYAGLTVEDEIKQFELVHFSNYSEFPSQLRKVKVLVLGGFYAGFPVSAYQVLALADLMAFENFAGVEGVKELFSRFEIFFVPVLNEKAFEEMEENWHGGGFEVLKTGLEGNDLNCTGVDVGINPYFNFDFEFEAGEDRCSAEYAGGEAFESQVAKGVFDEFFEGGVDIVVNYQGVGKKYIVPPSSSNSTIPENLSKFYSKLNLPEGYSLTTSLNSTGHPQSGTFLDYASSKSSLSIEVALELSQNKSSIPQTLTSNYSPFLQILQNFMPNLTIQNLIWSEYKCKPDSNSTCHYNSYLYFKFHISNSGLSKLNFTLKFDPGFKKIIDYTAVSIMISNNEEKTWIDSSFYTFPTSQILSVDGLIEGFSESFIKILYGKNTKNKLGGFKSFSSFISQEFLVDDVNFEYDYKVKGSSGGGQGERAVIVGWILMGVILAVVAIAAGLLKFIRSGEIFDNLTKENVKPPNMV